ncbi:BMP family ABC transporter substrate-binding protein [Marinobacter shengliensis]|uniref:BMP family ABC transporter substrate-binding protein n=1 Tax=Marinobacter shengliensis TaxID=1389223 RepID=UPI0025731451|nr:BMP family ABC transporter substrate-binding protein [Marinobacter shengliensis]BEH12764.1 hypothetical protein MAALD49_01320 [Marinobacter shengliensis]
MKAFCFVLSVILWCLCAPLRAQPFAPAILFNSEIILDDSYNESLLEGMKQFQARKGISFVKEAESELDAYLQTLKNLAEAGRTPILVPGAHIRPMVESVAPQYPETTFIAIDYVLDLPNVRSVVFDEYEGAYLAGVLAARASVSKQVAFVGGISIKPVRSLQEGFESGFYHVKPEGRVTVRYLADVIDRPWDDVAGAYSLGKGLYQSGYDVVFVAAGNAGRGILRAAFESGKYAIGVDRNQNGLYPGHVLTSVVKHLDRAVYVALVNERWNLWRSPVKQLGLAQGGVSISIDDHNRPLLTPSRFEEIEQIREGILLGYSLQTIERGLQISEIEKPDLIELVIPAEAQPPFIVHSEFGPAGLAFDAMELAGKQLGVDVDFRVLPTRRGEHLIKHDQVDGMLFALWSSELEEHGEFPRRTGQLDEDRAMMIWDLAAYQRKEDVKNGTFVPRSPFTVPPGFGRDKVDGLKQQEVHVIETPERQLRMLLRGHTNTALADAVYTDYLIAATPVFSDNLIKISPSMAKESSYLVLSESFYQRYPAFSEQLWNRLSEIRESVALWDNVERYFAEAGLDLRTTTSGNGD